MIAHDIGIGIVHHEYQASSTSGACSQGVETTLVVKDIIKNKVAGNQIEMLLVFRQRLTEISHPVLNLALRIFRARKLDQVWSNINACNVGTSPGQNSGKIAFATPCV